LTRREPITFKETLQGGVELKKRRSTSDAQDDSFKWRKADGEPLSEDEDAEVWRLSRIFWETAPDKALVEPIKGSFEPLKEWLVVKFDAVYSLIVILEPDTARMSREEFIFDCVLFVREYLQKHLDPAVQSAVKTVVNDLHDQIPGLLAMMGGSSSADVRRLLPARKQIESNREEAFRRYVEGVPQRDGRGGDHRSDAGLTEAKWRAITERKNALTPFWTELIKQFEANWYGADVWGFIKSREEFKKQCAKYNITSINILDELAPKVVERKPYWEKEKTDPMPEPLYPSSFALIHAAREEGVSGDYWGLRQKITRGKRQARRTRRSKSEF
jgi:hypothetical protein